MDPELAGGCALRQSNQLLLVSTSIMDEITRLQNVLLAAGQRQREEEQRRREEAEEAANTFRPLTLEPYLESCHTLSHAIEVVTDRSLTTQGETTDLVGRVYPRRIIPWEDFSKRQEEIWDYLSEPSFTIQEVFPSQNQLEYVQLLIRPISSESGLRDFERDTVENAVQKLVDAAHSNLLLRKKLDLRGAVTLREPYEPGKRQR